MVQLASFAYENSIVIVLFPPCARRVASFQGTARVITADHLSDRMKTNLPEFARLEFVLSTPALKDLRSFVETHRTVQQPKLYQGESAISVL